MFKLPHKIGTTTYHTFSEITLCTGYFLLYTGRFCYSGFLQNHITCRQKNIEKALRFCENQNESCALIAILVSPWQEKWSIYIHFPS